MHFLRCSRRILWGVGVLLIWQNGAKGQQALPEDRGTVGLCSRSKNFAPRQWRVHIVAHPDDEDGPMLTYLARGLGARAMLLSLTRAKAGPI